MGSLRRCLWALPEDGPPGSEQLQHFGGGWLSLALLSHLPTFQMTLYLTFPVAMFWIANQAEWFEDAVIQRKVGAGRVFKGSSQGMGEGMGTNLLGTNVCLL